MDVGKQVNEMEYFLNISEHLKVVLDRFSNQESTDKNDLYDLVYSKRKLEVLKDSGISNTDLLNDVNDLLSRIQLILDMLKPDDIENIMETKIKDTSKLNKAKYGKKAVFENVTDSGNVSVISKIGGFNTYFRSRMPKLITLLITGFLIIVVPNVTEALFSTTDSNIEQSINTEDNVDADVEQASEMILKTENINTQEIKLNSLKNMISIITKLLLIIIFVTSSIQLLLDMLYIVSYGQIGKLIKADDNYDVTNSIISPEAQNAITTTYETETHKVNSNDRIEVASALLNNMINYLEKQEKYALQWVINPININKEKKLKSLGSLKDELQEIKGRTLMSKGINKIEAYVDAEITYEQLRKSMNKDLDWLNNLENN